MIIDHISRAHLYPHLPSKLNSGLRWLQTTDVANLAPATLRGVRSEGMLLAASGDAGSILLVPDAPAPPGAGVK